MNNKYLNSINKHAYLIIAHDNFKQLKILVSLLDNYFNDIYIHIDKKSCLTEYICTEKSHLFIITGEDAIDVRWGDISQIQCEMLLFEKALSSDYNYTYYHLISGYCLPIKNLEYIYLYFEKHKGRNFIGFDNTSEIFFAKRIIRRHYFTKYYKDSSLLKRVFFIILRLLFETFANIILPTKRKSTLIYKKGANWCSLTHDFVKYMIDNKSFILTYYKNSYCADEVYKQTLIWNSHFKDTIWNYNEEFKGCMRLIDWSRGKPYIFGQDPKDHLIVKEAFHLFARKFDVRKYPLIVEYVEKLVLNDK